METKHTKGGWEAMNLLGYPRFHSPVYVRPKNGGNTICRIDGGNVDEVEANAKLIAASPDLLEACMNLENDDDSIPDHAWQMIQAAIKKALK